MWKICNWKIIFCELVYVPAHDKSNYSPEITDSESTASTLLYNSMNNKDVHISTPAVAILRRTV